MKLRHWSDKTSNFHLNLNIFDYCLFSRYFVVFGHLNHKYDWGTPVDVLSRPARKLFKSLNVFLLWYHFSYIFVLFDLSSHWQARWASEISKHSEMRCIHIKMLKGTMTKHRCRFLNKLVKRPIAVNLLKNVLSPVVMWIR